MNKGTQLVIIVVGICILVAGSATWYIFSVPTGLKAVDSAQLTRSIHSAAKYLVAQIEDNGRFVYRRNMNPKHSPRPSYNMLRHAGAIYSLRMYLEIYPDQNMAKKVNLAASYLMSAAIKPLRKHPHLMAVWTDPMVLGRQDLQLQAKLGGTGLGLVALTQTRQASSELVPLENLRKLGQFVGFLQKDNGGFYSKYFPGPQGRSDKWDSLYYPGEAALGVLMLHEQDPSQEWLQIASKALNFLAEKRQGKGTQIEADHWALLATQRLLRHYSEISKPPLSQEALFSHAAQISQKMINDFQTVSPYSSAYGGSMSDGRTTPTATRLEGLLAAYEFLPPGYDELKNKIRPICQRAMAFLLSSQIKEPGEFFGAIPRALGPISLQNSKAQASFNRRSSEVRIDYVQHALSAMLQYQALGF